MLKCKEIPEKELTGQVFAAARLSDQGRYVPLSPEAVDRIKATEKKQGHRTFKTGGVGIYRATVVGTNGDSHLVFDPNQHLAFSIDKDVFERRLPNTFEMFPHRS